MLNDQQDLTNNYNKKLIKRRIKPSVKFTINLKNHLIKLQAIMNNNNYNNERRITDSLLIGEDLINTMNEELNDNNSLSNDNYNKDYSQSNSSLDYSQEKDDYNLERIKCQIEHGIIFDTTNNCSFFASPVILAKRLNYDSSTVNSNFKKLFTCDLILTERNFDEDLLPYIRRNIRSWHKYYTKNNEELFYYLDTIIQSSSNEDNKF